LQCDWWRAKVCPHGLHTKGQRPTDKALQNAYIAAFFVGLGAKSLFGGGKFVHNIYEIPNSPRADKQFFIKIFKIWQELSH
jgi:hypothetical protein